MIGYTCKYTPVELLEALGGEPVLLNGEAESFRRAEELVHPNLCSHAKALLEHTRGLTELVLVNCCDSVRRCYDVLRTRGDIGFLFFLDLPHREDGCARSRLKRELERLADAYSRCKGASFDPAAFRAACARAVQPPPSGDFLAVLGARVSRELLGTIRASLPLPVWDLTCGGNRALEAPLETDDRDALLEWYAGALLGQVPCMRMEEVGRRRALWEREGLRGILYHTVKFCDYYPFEYEHLKRETGLPILKLESDFTPQSAGQLSTRLGAFAEQLGLDPRPAASKAPGGSRLAVGIDSGSTTTNVVVLREDRTVAAWAIVRTGAKAQAGAEKALAQVEEQLGVDTSAFSAIVATGYGRNNIPFATAARTEITCHARGAHFLDPAVRTIIDIGGQDSKVICLDEAGAVSNFLMNDKCAAGTGRFLELMARTLELDLEEMGTAGLDWKEDLTISSMCTVFAESEVVSLIADNKPTADIVHGLNKSVASRTASIAARAGGRGPYMMTGGVARNRGVVRALEECLGEPLRVGELPDLCGALGAALFALEGG